MNKFLVTILILGLILVQACNNEDTPPVPNDPERPNLQINFEHFFDGEAFEINKIYLTENQDSVQITEHKYIVSNIVLKNTETSAAKKIDPTYFLVKVPLDGNSDSIFISGDTFDLQASSWDQIEFYIGLDSATNFAPEGGPKLFSDEGMFWEWNSGYKFYVTEGRYFSKDLPFPSVGTVAHIGEMRNLVVLKFDFSSIGGLNLQSGRTTEINLEVSVDQLYFNPNLIDMSNSAYWQAMGGPAATTLRQNYATDYWKLMDVQNP